MTNKERAVKICVESKAVTGDFFPLRVEIERALDEAEKREHKKGYEEGTENMLKVFDRGKLEGQKEMRERAAKARALFGDSKQREAGL